MSGESPNLQNRARNLTQAWRANAKPPDVDLSRLRQGRLARVRTELARRDCAACVLLDPINIRYATDALNMTVFMLRNPVSNSCCMADSKSRSSCR